MSDAAVGERRCSNAECDFGTTGRCLEGLELDKCPHLDDDELGVEVGSRESAKHQPTEEIEAEPSDGATEPESEEHELVEIGGDTPLDTKTASRLLRRVPAEIVAFVGPVKAGKTCIIACVYDTFQYGAYKRLRFTGSQTLMAFERISHSARAASDAETPEEGRSSSLDEVVFYHMTFSDAETLERTDLLLADRSGEFYEAVANQPSRAKEFVELEQGIVVNVLIDGRGLCDLAERHVVQDQARSVIDALASSGVSIVNLHLNFVLTKYDLVAASDEKDRAMEDFSALVSEIKAGSGKQFASVNTFVTAASPQVPGIEKGHGVENLIISWSNDKRLREAYVASPIKTNRAMDHLSLKGD